MFPTQEEPPMRPQLTAVLCVLVLFVPAAPAAAQPKQGTNYAFLVACSEYREGQFKRLPYAYPETEDFRQALLATGFDDKNVVFLHNKRTEQAGRFLPLRDNILHELDLLAARLTKDDTLVVLLNGHGLHFKGDKASYFCPSNVNLDKKETLLPLDGDGGVYALLQKCKAGRKLLLVNACRNDPDPLNQAAAKDSFDNEAKETLPEGVAALFSCSPGQKCYYYPPSAKIERSLFMNHLIEAWRGMYAEGESVTLEDVFKDVKGKAAADAAKLFGEKQLAVIDRQYTGEWVVGASRVSRARAFYDRGNKQRLEKDYKAAIESYTRAIELDPKYAVAYNNRGNTYRDQKDYTKAIADYTKAIELDPKYTFPYHNRGLTYADQKEYAKAIADYTRAIELDPKYARAYRNRGVAYASQQEYVRAVADYSKAIELDPKFTYAYNDRGNAYNNQREYVRAVADYTKAIELDPKYAVAYNNRGNTYRNQREYAKAVADLTRAIELDPKYPSPYNNRGLAYADQKEYSKAVADYTRAIAPPGRAAVRIIGDGLASGN
jgi:tetratricopeptide (TPR) repeat protein